MSEPRERVKALNRTRKAQRGALLADVEQAKHDLHPRTIATRWRDKQLDRAAHAAEKTKQAAQKNAPAIGLAGIGILLFAFRKPISRAIKKLRAPRTD
jgi:hypothetical protein